MTPDLRPPPQAAPAPCTVTVYDPAGVLLFSGQVTSPGEPEGTDADYLEITQRPGRPTRLRLTATGLSASLHTPGTGEGAAPDATQQLPQVPGPTFDEQQRRRRLEESL